MNKENDLREIDVFDKDGKITKGLILFTFEEAGDVFISYISGDKIFFGKLQEDNSLLNLEEDEYKIVNDIWVDFSKTDKFKNILKDYGYEGFIDEEDILDNEIKNSYQDIDSNNKKESIN